MKIYLRILRYIKPYWIHLVGSTLCIFLFVIFSSISLFSVMPFLSTIFDSQGNAGIEAVEIVNETSPSLPGESIQEKFDTVKQEVYRFFLGSDWQQNRSKSLQQLCILMVIIIFLKSLFGYLQAYFMATVEQGIIKDIRDDIYTHMNKLSLSYFHHNRTGKLISRITNDVNLVNSGISASFFTMVKDPLLVIVYLTFAFFLSWELSLIAVLILPFSLIIISWIGLKLRKESVVSLERIADVTSVLQETITGVRVVKAFGMEQFENRKFMNQTYAYFRTLLKLTRIRNLASPLTEFLGTTVGVGILWYGGQKVFMGNMLSPEEFIYFLLLIFSIMQPVKEISTVNNRIQEALAAGGRIFKIIDIEPEIQNSPDAMTLKKFEQDVVYQNVTFSYNGFDSVLDHINLKVKKGQVLAIVGPSGAGKSTLVDMLPRFYDPQEGKIEIDGYELKKIKIEDVRALMGIVTQETILFNDTVRNNIAYGLENISLKKVIQAAKVANAHDFIEDMEQGYDTFIGERGVKLSGGERQRLAIARAMLKDPPILVLDEATSSLDTESEKLVQEAMERLMKNRTSFVIAHRLSTILHAHEIVVLDEGKIVEQGTHLQLLKRGGLYRRLYDMQFRDITEKKI